MDDEFWMLRMFSIFTKAMSVVSFLAGLVLEGVTIYGWGRLTTYYDIIRVVYANFANSYNKLSMTGITGLTISSELAPMPIWPLIILIFFILLFMVVFALTLWAGGQWIDMRITQAKEEREFRDMLAKAMSTIARDLTFIAGYFSSLPSPHK